MGCMKIARKSRGVLRKPRREGGRKPRKRVRLAQRVRRGALFRRRVAKR